MAQATIKSLELRTLPPPQRHQLVFKTYAELESGEAFELVNDHDPKPLYYQLSFENKDQFTWEYLEEGPTAWRVRIRKN